MLDPDDPVRLGMLPDLGSALSWAGEMDDSSAVFAEAIERAAAAGEEQTRMHAAIKRRLALLWGDVLEARSDAEPRAVRPEPESGLAGILAFPLAPAVGVGDEGLSG